MRALPVVALLVLQAGCGRWAEPVRPRPAVVDSRAAVRALLARDAEATVTVEPVGRDALVAALGVRRVRALEPAWVVVRLRVTPPGGAHAVDVDGVLEVEEGGRFQPLPTQPPTVVALSELTGERPADHVYHVLKTGDAPWPAHVLTVGIYTILTLHFERNVKPPTEAEVRAVAPRAIAFERLVAGSCPRAGGCERLVVVRRPRDPAAPLRLRVEVTARGGDEQVSRGAVWELPPGATLEERLTLPPAVARGPAPSLPPREPSARERAARALVAPALAPWPPAHLAPIDIPAPPPAGPPQTPDASRAARPWFAGSDLGFAPSPPLALLDGTLPVEDQVEGGVVDCEVGALRIPGEDDDHVYAEARLGRRWWRIGGRHASTALVSIGPRGALPLALYDWDWLSGDDLLVSLPAVRDGNRLRARLGGPTARREASIECRLYGRAAVTRAAEEAWVRAVDALEGFEEEPLRVRPDEGDLGWALAGGRPARAAVEALAGLVGWSDPRVVALVGRFEAADRRFWQAARAAVEALPVDAMGAVRLGKPPADPDLVVLEAARSCPPRPRRGPAPPCGLRVVAENHGRFTTHGLGLLDTRVILDDGRVVSARAQSAEPIAPGTRGAAQLALDDLPAPSRAATPWRLVVRGRGEVAILPIAPVP